MRPFSKFFSNATPPTSRTTATHAATTPAPAAQQPALPKVRKTSGLPGPLRGLLDSRTAKYQQSMARLSDDTELQQALLGQRPGMNGRMTRAVYQEAKKRMESGQWNPQPAATGATHAPAPTPASRPIPGAPKTSHLPGPLRNVLDGHTAKYERASVRFADDAKLQQVLLGQAPGITHRMTRAAYQEAKNRADQGQWNPPPSAAAPRADGTEPPSAEADHAQTPAPAPTQTPAPAPDNTPAPDTNRAPSRTSSMRSSTVHPEPPTEAPHAAPAGPVIDPDTGALNKANLRKLVNDLTHALPAVPPKGSQTGKLSQALKDQLNAIATIAADGSRKPPHETGLAVRDAFAGAAQTARQLARNVGGGDLAEAYKGIAALLNEFKRTHLSASAHDVMSHYANKEAANLERKAPGIGQGKGGCNVVTSTTGGLTYSLLPKTGYTGPDISVGVGGGKGRLYLTDDDGDIDHWPSLQAFVKAVLGGKLGQWVARLVARLDLLAGSTWFEHNDLREMVKLVANNDANHAWMPSAGPNARKVRQALEALVNTLSTAVGRNYTESAGKPLYLNDAKIAKGFNTFKMTLLAAAIDEKLEKLGNTGRFGNLVSKAYPSTVEVLTQRLHSGGEQPLPLAPRRDVPDSVGYADGALYYRQATASVDASIGNQTHGGTNLEAGGIFGLNLRGNVAQYFMEFGESPHAQLDPGHQKDYQSVFKQHQLLDEVCGHGAPPAQLFLYDSMRKALMQMDQRGTAMPFTETDRRLYGDAAAIPIQFRNAITHASPDQLNHAAGLLKQLQSTYLAFVSEASPLLAKNDKFMPAQQRDTLNRLRDSAFQQINQLVWQGRYSQQDALKHPAKFVAQSHASLSLALGCAGTHLSVVKQQLAQRHALDPRRDTGGGSTSASSEGERAIKKAINDADSIYKTVREMMDKTYLPLKNYDVRTQSPLKEAGLWQRWDTALRAQASGGAQAGLFNTIMSRLRTKSTQVQLGDLTGTISVSDSAGQVSLAAEARLMYADHQLNPSRTGKFWQLTFTAQGGAPITGALINLAVKAAIEKFMPNMRLEDEKFDPHEIIRQAQGLLFDITDGTSIVVKLRQPPDVEQAAMQLQYVRVLRNKSSGPNVSLSIPTPVGTFTPSISHNDSGQSLAGEIVGTDKSYLIMQHPAFSKVVDPFFARIAADPGNTDAIAGELRQALDANPALRNRYLASPTMMADVVKEHFDAMAELAAAAAENRPPRILNEFLRYYATEPFARAANVSAQVASHAPGSTANGGDPFKIARSPLDERVSADAVNDLQGKRAHLQGLQTIEARADYLCGAEGRPLLEAFTKIVGNMRAINSAAFFHSNQQNIGFRSMLRDPRALARENKRIDAALNGKPESTGVLNRVRARLQPDRINLKEASVTELRALAEPNPQPGQATGGRQNRPIAEAAKRELARRVQRLGHALPPSGGGAPEA
ncbi:type III effector protein [Ralstonia pseudosolanacearum]|uniref:type III effector protein n=1 Tax=Ralstonia pseudosolanacearum TaxID=1310165 RepID=UPI001FF84DD4|nr:type III effector protein [Ralstonia pseudosolanacearum]